MEWYTFVNDDFEEIETSGFLSAEIAEKWAEFLARKYNYRVRCFQLVCTASAPAEGDGK